MLNKHPFQCVLYEEAGICGFTPVVIVTLMAMALGWATGYLDVILFPGLAYYLPSSCTGSV
jgi:hypothetical protein